MCQTRCLLSRLVEEHSRKEVVEGDLGGGHSIILQVTVLHVVGVCGDGGVREAQLCVFPLVYIF